MYHTIMKRVAPWAFDRLNAGDYDALLVRCKTGITHSFAGDHALGGTLHAGQAFRVWFERLFTLFRRLEFSIPSIAVSGRPAHTIIAVEWVDRTTPPDGVPYGNRDVHVLTDLGRELATRLIAAVFEERRLLTEGIEPGELSGC